MAAADSSADPIAEVTPNLPSGDALRDAQRLLRRVGNAEVRGRLHRTLVLWDLGYTREALSQFRLSAEAALSRLLDRASARPADCAAQRERLERGQAARVVEWLYNDAELVPARVALHLHTLLGWGNYASHHQQRGHHAQASDLAVLLSVAVDLEEWLALSAAQRSIFDADDSAWHAHEVERAGIASGLAEEVARRFVSSAGRGSRAEEDRLLAPQLGMELFFRAPLTQERGEAAPYRGLQCFEPEDAERFFGRDDVREQLVAGVETHALTVLCGASGVGKTSLLRAGLVPRLTEAGHGVLWLASYGADALRTAMQVIGAWPGDRLLVVLFDQLEHVMLPETPESLRRGLLEILLRAERWRYGIRMLVSLREDFLGRLLREADGLDREQAAALHDPRAFVALGPLSAEATRAAMERPLEGSGVRFDASFSRKLVTMLGGDGGTPPAQLQLICTRLYEQARERGLDCIDGALYQSVGGAEKILETHLDETLASARYEGHRAVARTLLKAMAGAETRRWVDLGELWQAARAAAQSIDAVQLALLLQRLADDRLIVVRTTGAGGTVEHSLVHDQLAIPVREWRSAQELERQQAQELLDRGCADYRDPRRRELLGGRSLKLVERHYRHLRRRESAALLLRASQRARLLRRGSTVALAALAAFGLVFGGVQLRHAVSERDRALAAADQGVLLQARLALSRDPSLAAAWLRNLSPRAGGVGVLTVLEDARYRGVARVLQGHGAPVTAVVFSRNGRELWSVGHDRKLWHWDASRARALGPPRGGHRAAIACLALSPDGSLLASGDLQNRVRLWDAKTGAAIGQPLTAHRNWVYGLAFAPKEELLASASLDGTIRLWRWSKRGAEPLAVLQAHRSGVTAVAFSPDGRTLASAGRSGALRLWDVATRRPRGEPLLGHHRAVPALVFSPDGALLASGSLDATVRFWDPRDGHPVGQPITRRDAVIALAFAPDARTIASAGEDKAVQLWDVATRRPRGPPLRGHVEFVRSLAFAPDGRTLASASQDHTVRLWNLAARRGAGLTLAGDGQQWVHAVAFSPRGRFLASAARDGTIRLWERRSRRLRARLQGHADAVVSLSFSPDGRLLASASHDKTVRLWPLAELFGEPPKSERVLTLRQPRPAFRDDGPIYAAAFSPDGALLATGSLGELRLWRVVRPPAAAATPAPSSAPSSASMPSSAPTGTTTTAPATTPTTAPAAQLDPLGEPLVGHEDAVSSLAFAPDGKLLASASYDGTVQLWDVARRVSTGTLPRRNERLHQLAFSPDGRLLAVASAASTVQLYDVARRRTIGGPLRGHQHAVYAVAFSPDGKTLASAGADATLRLWRVRTRRPLGPPLRGHTGTIYTIAFSPDGRLLASGSADRSVWLWQTATVDRAALRQRIDALTNLHVGSAGERPR